MVHNISPTYIDFPEIFGDFPYNHHHLGFSVGWGRYNLNRVISLWGRTILVIRIFPPTPLGHVGRLLAPNKINQISRWLPKWQRNEVRPNMYSWDLKGVKGKMPFKQPIITEFLRQGINWKYRPPKSEEKNHIGTTALQASIIFASKFCLIG